MLHEITLIGRLSREAEMRYTPSGTAVTNLSVVTSKKVSKSTTEKCPDGWKEDYSGKNWECAIFWRATVWGRQAEACNEFLRKGSMVYITGEPNGQAENGIMNPRIWTGNDGQPHCSFEITARNVRFLSTRSESQQDQGQQQEPPPGTQPEEDIPF